MSGVPLKTKQAGAKSGGCQEGVHGRAAPETGASDPGASGGDPGDPSAMGVPMHPGSGGLPAECVPGLFGLGAEKKKKEVKKEETAAHHAVGVV